MKISHRSHGSRGTDLEEAESLIEALSAFGIELLPLAQSCAALAE